MSERPIFDTHIHIWDTEKLSLPWLKAFTNVLHTRYTLEDYLQASAGFDVRNVSYVEVDAAKDDNLIKEADSITHLAAQKNIVSAIVLGGDLSSQDFAAYIKNYASNPHVVGVRDGGLGFSNGDIYLQPIFIKNIQLLGELNLNCELLPLPQHLEQANKLVELCPKTRFIIDHCGFISPHEEDENLVLQWRQGMQNYAQLENTVCKISGLLQNAYNSDWTYETLAPVVDFCLDTFGEDRVVFASNWPVCTLHGSFKRWVDALKQIVMSRSETFQDKLFYQNALRYYVK